MGKFVRFISYNNAVPIGLGLLFFGSASAFAATNPQAIYSQTQKVISVDNSYIANIDLANFSPRATVTQVSEDADNYYVAYTFSTIGVQDYVWRDINDARTLTVSKAELGSHGDLGLYVTKQFNQLISHEKDDLLTVQTKARADLTPKVVATEYGGLVGKFLDGSTETLPGYTPVVAPDSNDDAMANTAAVVTSSSNGSASAPCSAPSSSPSGAGLQVLGNNPARISLNASYIDLGVFIADQNYVHFGISLKLDGADVPEIVIDSSKVGTHTILYTVIDQNGNSISATRTITVYDPSDPSSASSTPAAPVSPPETPSVAPCSAPVSSPAVTPPVTPPAPPVLPTPVVIPPPDTSSSTPPASDPTPTTTVPVPDVPPVATTTPDTSSTTDASTTVGTTTP